MDGGTILQDSELEKLCLRHNDFEIFIKSPDEDKQMTVEFT